MMAKDARKLCQLIIQTLLLLMLLCFEKSSVYSLVEEQHNTDSLYTDPELKTTQDTCKDPKECQASRFVWFSLEVFVFWCIS